MLIATNTLAGALLAAAGTLGCPETCQTTDAAAATPAPTAFFSPEARRDTLPTQGDTGRYFFVKKGDKDSNEGSSNISIVNDDGAFSLTIKDGQILEAKVDGEKIPEDRIIREGDTIRFVDEDGEELVEFHVGDNGAIWFGDGEAHAFSPEVMAFGMAEADEEPRPMIGVTLEGVDETVADQLGLDPDEVVLIAGVTEGMPAEKAGLKRSDIVVKIDGSAPATEERLREIILSRKDGEKITLGIVRKGKPQDITIEVKEVRPAGGVANTFPRTGQWRALDADARRQMEREIARASAEAARAGREAGRMAMEDMKHYGDAFKMHAHDTAKMLAEVRERLQKEYEKLDLKITPEDREKLRAALDRVTAAIEEMDFNIEAPRVRIFRGQGMGADALLAPAPAPPGTPAPPAPPSPPAAQSRRSPASDERLDRLEQRMDRIQELLEKMAEKNDR